MMTLTYTDHPDDDARRCPVSLLVRDGCGHPLPGVRLALWAPGPPHRHLTFFSTGRDGACQLWLPEGSYLLSFEGGWRGRKFVRRALQAGGFGLPVGAHPEDPIAFVLGLDRVGRLHPVIDLSRSAHEPPYPLPPGWLAVEALHFPDLSPTEGGRHDG